jgi:regulator of sirC expression with transglutaminase-like and TPR domain
MTSPVTASRADLLKEMGRSEPEVDLARAALLVAREEYPQLPVDRYLARLDELAERVVDRLANERAPMVVLTELVRTLYESEGFRGNRDAYYDPRNSFLNDVLDRRVGIPLTLAITVLEVGWRLDLPLEGVNFPRHFMVRFKGEGVNILLDPFEAGELRFEDQAQELLDRVYGGTIRMRPSFLEAATKRNMVVRLLTNLKGIYFNAQDDVRALAAVERLMLLSPEVGNENRDRGILLARLGRTEEALGELERYLDHAPDAPDAGRIRGVIDGLRTGGPAAAVDGEGDGD